MEDEMIELEERKIFIPEEIKNFPCKSVFQGNNLCSGCGSLLGLKMALQASGESVLVLTPNCLSSIRNYISMPSVEMKNAAATASGITKKVVVYADDSATSEYLQSVIASAERNDNVIYICNNNQCNDRKFSKSIPAVYNATASVSHPDDYIKKLKKANAIEGFKFIDLLAPCPEKWGFDHSNTIEVARLAVETGFWPLFEVENKKVEVTVKTTRLEPVERYFGMQKKYNNFKDLEKLKERISKNYRLLAEGKFL
jgi:pyruvate ferredoxin oxidoreductase beta subunit